jgi:signal transduction histidine kinase
MRIKQQGAGQVELLILASGWYGTQPDAHLGPEAKLLSVGNERYKQYLKDIHTSGGHLISLLNDLLDLSKIEAGKLDLEALDFDLRTTLEDVASELRKWNIPSTRLKKQIDILLLYSLLGRIDNQLELTFKFLPEALRRTVGDVEEQVRTSSEELTRGGTAPADGSTR